MRPTVLEHAAPPRWITVDPASAILRLATPRRVQVAWLGLSVAGVMVLAWCLLVIGGNGVDTYAYWRAGRGDPYAIARDTGAFHYSPIVVTLLALPATLPWPVFNAAWLALNLAALGWLARRWALAALVLPPVTSELYHGNIHLLLAVAIGLGLRHPGAWAAVLITKVTPGIGLLWFVARREWRALAAALGATALLVAVGVVARPDLWPAWIDHLQVAGGTPPPYLTVPMPVRGLAALALLLAGAATDRPWVVPVAAAVSLPFLWLNGLCLALAALPIRRASRLPVLRRQGRPEARPGEAEQEGN